MKKIKIAIGGFGLGFIVKKSEKSKDGKGRIFTEVELVEVSMISDNEPVRKIIKGGK